MHHLRICTERQEDIFGKNHSKQRDQASAIKVINKVEPTTQRTFSIFFAPQACPMSTVEPADKPMTKAIKQNRIGKNTATAAIALTPSICPTKTVLIVPERLCRMLVAINGNRNTRKAFHKFCCWISDCCAMPYPVIDFSSI